MKTVHEGKIVPLTAVRFFAALFVVFYHGWPRHPGHFGSRLIDLGYVSVSFFFMLSGFILAVVYFRGKKSINRRKFFISRFARIYPLYLATILLDLPHFVHVQLHIFHRPITSNLAAVAASFTLIQAWLPSFALGINGPSWSLSAEIFFYLLFPWLGSIIVSLKPKMSILLGIFVYFAGLSLVWMLYGPARSYVPLPHLFIFILGVQLAQVYDWIEADTRRKRICHSLSPYALLLCLALFLSIPVFHLTIAEGLLQHGLLAPLFAVTILALAGGNKLIATLLSGSWLVLLGEASFGLYLIHTPLLTMLRQPIERFGAPVFLLAVAVSVILSVLSFQFLEGPARRWILEKESVRSSETLLSSSLGQ